MTKTGPRGLTLSPQKQNQIKEYFLADKSAYLTSQETGISYRTVKKYYAIFTEELSSAPSVTDKPVQKKNQRPAYLAVGVIPTAQEHTDYHTGTYQKYEPEVVRTHIPQYNVVPYTSPRAQERRPLTAAELNPRSKNKKRLFPKFFMNPYQDLDYIVLQDIYANSVAGRIIDRIIELVFSRGIKPVLKLRNPEDFGDEAAQQKEIEKDQEIIDNLLLVDEAVSDPDDEIDPFLDSTIQTKFIALAKNAMVYGRSMIIKEFTKPIKLGDGNIVTGKIPNVLKVINPRDMGIVEIDQESWKLSSVQIRFTSENIVPQDMIYLEHGSNNPVYNGLHYGYSAMQSMIGASRSLKQMIEVDFPTITKHLWSGSGSIVTKPEGTTEQEKAEELNNILKNYREGRWNGLMVDPENIEIMTHDLNPKIADLVQLADFLIRHNIAQTGMPQAIFAQEKDSNRATLIGKQRLFMDGPAATLQEWITNAIGKQWYMPNFRAIYPKDSEIYQKYRVEAAFEPLKLESFQDNVDAVMKLNREVPLTAEAIGELLNIDEFADKVDPDIPRGMGKGISLTDSEGNPFNMENA